MENPFADPDETLEILKASLKDEYLIESANADFKRFFTSSQVWFDIQGMLRQALDIAQRVVRTLPADERERAYGRIDQIEIFLDLPLLLMEHRARQQAEIAVVNELEEESTDA